MCPDCGGTHAHTPYEAAGTNEMGVTVSATETLHGSAEVCAVDPYADAGIEEAEIVTVLLSESSSAREAVELLLSIYDGAGCAGGAGLFIADDSEAWYIENLTGHQYMALKLNPTLVFVEPNMSIIGLIDLDDSDNVIASKGIIETAQQAGTFVGDIEANTIDFTASYNAGQTANSRMVSALNYLQSEAPDEPEAADYAITNVDADGNIVPLNTAIMTDKLAISDVVDFYAIDGIGNARTLKRIYSRCLARMVRLTLSNGSPWTMGATMYLCHTIPCLLPTPTRATSSARSWPRMRPSCLKVRPVIWTMPTSPATVYCLTTGTIRCTGHWTRCPI